MPSIPIAHIHNRPTPPVAASAVGRPLAATCNGATLAETDVEALAAEVVVLLDCGEQF